MLDPIGEPDDYTDGGAMELSDVFMDYQIKFLLDESPIRIYEKSRQIGITWTIAFECVVCASSARSAGGMHCYYMSKHQDDATAFIEDCEYWARLLHGVSCAVGEEMFEDIDGVGSIKVMSIRFASGFGIFGMSRSASRIRSKRGRVYLDEFAFHPQQEEVFAAAGALTIWGGRITILSTHNGVGSEFNRLIEAAKTGAKDYSLHRTTFQEAIQSGLYRKVCERLGQEWTLEGQESFTRRIYSESGDPEQELDVIPRNPFKNNYMSLNDVIRQSCITTAQCPVFEVSLRAFNSDGQKCIEAAEIYFKTKIYPRLIKLDATVPCYVGIDFGRTNNLSVITVLQKYGEVLKMAMVVEMECFPFAEQEYIIFEMLKSLPMLQGGRSDKIGIGMRTTEKLERLLPTTWKGIAATERLYAENIPVFRSRIAAGNLMLVQHTPLRNEILSIQINQKGFPYLPDAKTMGLKTPDGKERHGDGFISLFLATLCLDTGGFEPKQVDIMESAREICDEIAQQQSEYEF